MLTEHYEYAELEAMLGALGALVAKAINHVKEKTGAKKRLGKVRRAKPVMVIMIRVQYCATCSLYLFIERSKLERSCLADLRCYYIAIEADLPMLLSFTFFRAVKSDFYDTNALGMVFLWSKTF